MNSKKTFIILTTQRSGSTYLRIWLNSHADIRCHEEIFLSDYVAPESFCGYLTKRHFGSRMIRSLTKSRTTDGFLFRRYLRGFLNKIYSTIPPGTPMSEIDRDSKPWAIDQYCSAKWVGMKLMANQLASIPALRDELISRNVHVISLVRKSNLEIYVSRVIAENRGIYHSTEDLPEIQIDLDPDLAVREMQQIFHSFENAKRQFEHCPGITIYYENLFDERRQMAEMGRIMEFLGLSMDRLGPTPKLKKLVNQPIDQVVNNYSQIAKRLESQGLE